MTPLQREPMPKQVVSRWPAFAPAIAAGLLVLGCSLLLVAAPRSQMAQTQSTDTVQSGKSSGARRLVVVSLEARDKTIRFGDALDILITFQNQGKEPITIPADALVL